MVDGSVESFIVDSGARLSAAGFNFEAGGLAGGVVVDVKAGDKRPSDIHRIVLPAAIPIAEDSIAGVKPLPLQYLVRMRTRQAPSYV